MNRTQLMLAILAAAEGQAYTPVQIQKSVFLVSRNLPNIVTEGPSFVFAPYDYGPFDRNVYSEAEILELQGLATVNAASARWRTYAATPAGVESGRAVLDSLPAGTRDYIKNVSAWVRSLDFATLVKSVYEAYPDTKVNSIFQG